jgi:hypothetical protein
MNKEYLKKNWAGLQFGAIAFIQLLLTVWGCIIENVLGSVIIPHNVIVVGAGVLFTSGMVMVASEFLKKN